VMREVVRGDEIADELERRGHDVMLCPGPQPPRLTCPGARGERCPLTTATDVVVLDGWLAPDELRRGVPYWHLALYYHGQGLPVVVLVGPQALPGPVPDDMMIPLDRSTSATDIGLTVDELLERRAAVVSSLEMTS